uniref:Transmembrane protein 186 n=1 Tax=Parastrongyloides trichosuri TaxID=131310 RepID=A0A0N4Z4L2_PARTI
MVFLQGLVVGRALIDSIARRQGTVQHSYRKLYSDSSNMGLRRRKGSSSTDAVLNFTKPRPVKRTNPYEKKEVINRIGGTSIRKLHTTIKTRKDVDNLKEMMESLNFTPIYKFNGIWIGAFFAKAKIVQTIASLLIIPFATYKLYIGSYDFQYYMTVICISLLAPLMLFAFAKYYSRLVGVISMSEDNNFIRVGYLSFYGTRQNRYIKTEDVLPIYECTNKTTKHMIVPLQQYSRTDPLYLATKGVQIVDEERASFLFGDLTIFNYDKKTN